jgi:hypothetical protein
MKTILLISFLCVNYCNAQIAKVLYTDSIKTLYNIPNNLKLYYLTANNAQYALFKKKYTEALLLYNKAFLISKPQSVHLEDIVECYYYSNQKDSALKYANLCIELFGINNQRMKDTVLELFFKNEDFKIALGRFYSRERIVKNIAKIEHYIHNDLFFRNELKNFKLNVDSCYIDKERFSFKIALQYDSIYAIPYVTELINDYNFPNAYDIGSQSTIYLMFLLRHYNIEKHILDSALVNGKILPRDYASLVDYKYNVDWELLFSQGKFRPKGNFGPNLKMIDGKMIMGEIDDIENVDKRRENIGLMPLWQDAKMNGYHLSKEYKTWLKKNNIPFEQ